MARKLDQILVVDVEATCWEGAPPPGQISEIIEIGLCVLDVATLARVERRDILVRPVSSMVSSYCSRLTTLTKAHVDDGGIPLVEACQILAREYQAPARLWARPVRPRQCRHHAGVAHASRVRRIRSHQDQAQPHLVGLCCAGSRV
jgi:inhibitor of KinA sporulation pathway (predicted exonuclease)